MKIRPLIGVLPTHSPSGSGPWVRPWFLQAMNETGADAVMVPAEYCPPEDGNLNRFDGFLIPGGTDVDPSLYGAENTASRDLMPERDRANIDLLRAVVAYDKPVLGICHGCQILNVALGGSLIQDIAAASPAALEHYQKAPDEQTTHPVSIVPGGLLDRIFKTEEIMVNSFHHQAVGRLAPRCRLEAAAPDGVVEAFSLPGRRFVLGVQWHPELLTRRDRRTAALFDAFVSMTKI